MSVISAQPAHSVGCYDLSIGTQPGSADVMTRGFVTQNFANANMQFLQSEPTVFYLRGKTQIEGSPIVTNGGSSID